MTRWACTNCGSVFIETGLVSVSRNEESDEHYLSEGVCPGCGGRGVVVAKVPEADQKH